MIPDRLAAAPLLYAAARARRRPASSEGRAPWLTSMSGPIPYPPIWSA